MGVILRIDVDYAYEFPYFNYLRMNYYFPRIKLLGYEKCLISMLDDLNDRNIGASFFFKTKTVPSNPRLLAKHDVGLHLVYAETYADFVKEFTYIENKVNRKIRGFTKHGSGTLNLMRNHAWEYKLELYVEWAERKGLDYFSGNGEQPDVNKVIRGNTVFYPDAYWLKEGYRSEEYDIDWLVDYSANNDVVVLTHPYNWVHFPQVRKEYEKLVSKIDDFKFFPSSL